MKMRAWIREQTKDTERPRDWGQLEAVTTPKPAGAPGELGLADGRQNTQTSGSEGEYKRMNTPTPLSSYPSGSCHCLSLAECLKPEGKGATELERCSP